MCGTYRGARCVDAATAKSWWGSPILLPRRGDVAQFIVQHNEARFGPGDGERHLPSSLVLVLTFGGVSPREGSQPKVLDSGGIVLIGSRTTRTLTTDTGGRAVPVRGHVGTYGDAESVTTGDKFRYVQWSVRDGDHFIVWRAFDAPRYRSLDELVHVLDALPES